MNYDPKVCCFRWGSVDACTRRSAYYVDGSEGLFGTCRRHLSNVLDRLYAEQEKHGGGPQMRVAP